MLISPKYSVSQKKGSPLKSSVSAACSNLNALTPQRILIVHCKLIESCSAKITQMGMHEYRQRRANTCIKILCSDF